MTTATATATAKHILLDRIDFLEAKQAYIRGSRVRTQTLSNHAEKHS